MKLLHVDSSILGPGSVSRELTALIMARLTAGGGAEVIYRDLAAEALPHMSAASLPGAHPLSATAEPQDDAARAVRETSDRLLEEFLAADTVVIGAPMYNFTVPTQLKAWLDRLAVAGRSFAYTEAGPEGLLTGKRVIVALASGGQYADDSPFEHSKSYLRAFFNFLGIEPEFVGASGIALGAENALEGAERQIEALAA